jgi:hypothetical protein
MNKKAQAWGIDLMIAVVMFSMGIVTFYLYTINNPAESKEAMEFLFTDGKIIGDTILSEGVPADWNSLDVIKIGVLTDNKIDSAKLQQFYDLAQTNYSHTKKLFGTSYDYYFTLDKNFTTIGQNIDGIGKPGFDKNNINARDLIKITRFSVYQDEPTAVYLYIFRE